MFRLPVCPYCGKKLDYKASLMSMGVENIKCRQCGKLSRVKFKAACAGLGVLFFLLLVGINTLMFFYGNNRTLLPHFIVTVTVILIFMSLTPLRVKLLELPGQRDSEPKLKKNRHRRKKVRYDEVLFDEDPLKGTSFED